MTSGRNPGRDNSLRGVDSLHVDGNDSRTPFPALPQAPADCFSREEIVNEMLDLTDRAASVARWVREDALIVPVLLRDVAGTCGVCGSYPLGC